MTCLLTWTLQKAEEGITLVGCPTCRGPFLKHTVQRSRQPVSLEEQELLDGIQQLASWTPGGSDEYAIDDDTWILRAEDLWDKLCNAILDDLVQVDDLSLGPVTTFNRFLDHHVLAAEQILSFERVYNFYQAHTCQEWRPDRDTQIKFKKPYQRLIAHLQTASSNGISEESWRVY
ncbi:MAG: hypothetical protein Q9213_002648 [Squamulea squamosa]